MDERLRIVARALAIHPWGNERRIAAEAILTALDEHDRIPKLVQGEAKKVEGEFAASERAERAEAKLREEEDFRVSRETEWRANLERAEAERGEEIDRHLVRERELEAKLQATELRERELEERADELESDLKASRRVVEFWKAQAATLLKRNQTLQKRADEAEEQLEGLRAEDELDAAKKRVDEVYAELDKVEAENTRLRADYDVQAALAAEQRQHTEDNYDKLCEEIQRADKLEADHKAAEERLNEMEGMYTAMVAKTRRVEDDLQSALRRNESLKARIADYEQQIRELSEPSDVEVWLEKRGRDLSKHLGKAHGRITTLRSALSTAADDLQLAHLRFSELHKPGDAASFAEKAQRARAAVQGGDDA